MNKLSNTKTKKMINVNHDGVMNKTNLMLILLILYSIFYIIT